MCDPQLVVKGCSNVYESFLKFCEVETLDGANQYKAEEHGLQVGPALAARVEAGSR